jgi:hypothetical protein
MRSDSVSSPCSSRNAFDGERQAPVSRTVSARTFMR